MHGGPLRVQNLPIFVIMQERRKEGHVIGDEHAAGSLLLLGLQFVSLCFEGSKFLLCLVELCHGLCHSHFCIPKRFLLLRHQVALSEIVIDHLYEDINALHVRTAVTDAELGHVLDHFDVDIERTSIGTLHFADVCHIDKTDGIHVVYDGANGPVTAIYLPGKEVKRLQAISRDQFQGIIFPYHEGVMAIIGLMGEDVLQQKDKVEKALLWKTAGGDIHKAST